MNEKRLRRLVRSFTTALDTDPTVKEHLALHRARVPRAQAMLNPGRIPTLGVEELRELFYDTDAFGFWTNKGWEFDKRIASVGLEGLRAALAGLVERAQLGLTHDDLQRVWAVRGLGRLMSTELLAYRFPRRYWIYTPKITLASLAALGDDVRAALPRGRKSDPHAYLALAPRMLRLQQALEAAGVLDADNLTVDAFLWWVRREAPVAGERDSNETEKALETAEKPAPRRRRGVREPGAETPVSTEMDADAVWRYLQSRGLGASSGAGESPVATPMRELLASAVRDQGLHLSDWHLAAFVTALQVKGFVILTGISGTGKTRLAQHFAAALPQPEDDGAPALPHDAIVITVQPTSLRHGRVIVPAQALRLFDPPVADEARDLRITCGEVRERAPLVRASFGGRDYLALTLRGAAREWLSRHVTPGDALVLEPELDQDDLLDGFRLSTRADWPTREVPAGSARNALFVPVRPDWRDGKALLGYFNPLTRTYEWTAFLRFILRAAQAYRARSPLAFFVLLDEMNLAHVEHYFADLLSVLESGRDADGWTREALSFGYPIDAEGDLPPHELRLPPNLYIVGTVNVDETTRPFSPKVLDRAFTLELGAVDFSAYLHTPAAPPTPSPTSRRALLASFTREGRFARIEKPALAEYVTRHPDTRARLASLNALLEPHELHFGYRVFDEVVAFLLAADESGVFSESPDAAFDAALLMKVLPKFHGARARLEAPLLGLLGFCVDPDAQPPPDVRDALEPDLDGPAAAAWLAHLKYRLPRTAERAARLLRRLYADGYASLS